MGAEQANLLHSYTKGEDVDIVKLRTQLRETSAADSWSVLETQSAAIHRAAYSNDVETAKYMLEDFEPGQVYDMLKVTGSFKELENTPLHIAAYRGHSEMVNFLLKSLPDRKLDLVKLQNKKGETPLHAAVNSYKREAIEPLLSTLTEDQRCEVLNVKNKGNETVLHTAIHRGKSYTVKTILKSVPNVKLDLPESLDSTEAHTALHAAVSINNMKMVQLILSPLTEDQRYKVLVQKSYLDQLHNRVRHSLHESHTTVFHVAASNGHINILKYILESVPSKMLNLLKIQCEGGTVLHAAVNKNDIEMVKLILSPLTEHQRYEVLKQQAVLHAAASKDHTNIVQSILESVPNKMLDLLKLRYGQESNTSLHTAAIEKKSETVLTILQSVTQEGLKELQNIKNNQNQSIADLAAPELYYLYTTQELAVLKKRSEEKDTVIAGQAEEINDNRQKLAVVERQLKDDLAKQREDNTKHLKQVQLEKQQQDKDFTALKEKQMQQEATVKRQADELAVLKQSSEQKDTVIAGQAKELRSTRQEVTELRESYVQQETVITSQAEELQQLRHNQTEMLRMVEALEISMGKPTSDQENETDSDN